MPDEEASVDQSQATTTDNSTDTANAQAGEVTEGATDDINKQPDQQADVQPGPDGKSNDFIGEIPKELEPLKKDILKKYYSKTRELADERRGVEQVKKDAETLQQLMNYKPFQDWYNAQKGGTPTQDVSTKLTEEELEQIRTDPTKLDSYLNKKLESLVEQKYGQQMKTVQDKAEDMELAKEFEHTEKTYGEDFSIAHSSGELDTYYDKGLDFETAYASWKLKTGNSAMSDKTNTDKTAQAVNRSRQGMTEKPASSAGKLPSIKSIKVKGFDDAFDQAFAAALKGEKVKIDR